MAELLAARVAPLDGLRGLAVLATVGFHLPGVPAPGGVLGVDVFFVLSGFLIGSILLSEADRKRPSLVPFWAARCRRLVPALVVLLVVVGSVSWFVASPAQWRAWGAEGAWAAFYAQNLYMISTADNYFTGDAPSPFSHLWTLGLEEQFYLVFPLFVLAVYAAARKFWPGRVRLITFAVCASAAALGLGTYQGTLHSEGSEVFYYDPRTHSFGILAGVALACAAPAVVAWLCASPLRSGVTQVAGALSLGIVASLSLSPTTYESYVRLAAPAATCTTLVLIATCFTTGPVSRALSWRPLVFLGLISYGMYLWSVPVSASTELALGDFRETGWVVAPLSVGLIVLLAALSYRFVEQPVRRSRRMKAYPGTTIVVTLSALLVTGAAFLLVPSKADTDTSGARVELMALPLCVTDPERGTNAIVSHLGCTVYDSGMTPAHTVVLVGNSVAQSLEPGFAAAAAARNWRVWAVSVSSCQLVPDALDADMVGEQTCYEMGPVLEDILKTGEVDAIVAIDMMGLGKLGISQQVTEGYRNALASWSRDAKVLLVKDYLSVDPPGATTFTVSPQGAKVARGWAEKSGFLEETNRILESAARGLPDVRVVDINPFLCPDGWPCPVDIDGVKVRWDQVHFTRQGSALVSSFLVRQLEEWGMGPVVE